MLAEALCCERVRCLPSIWVSYRGQRFKCSSLLHAGTSCASTCAYYVCWSVGVCKHECWDAYMWMCPRPCINILYVCLRVIGPCRCLGSCVYSLGHSTEGFDLCPGLPASRYNEHVATGGMWNTSALLPLE